MGTNIFLAYILAFCKHSWFWLGIWVFYYLRFTDYAGIGLVETILVGTMALTEIPTGAIADLFGKRNTLILSFLLQAVGAIWMTVTHDFWGLAGSVFVMGIGGTFYSGTLEALVYDSLIQQDKQSFYDKTISTISSIQLVAPALCSIVGGLLYPIDPRLPFAANAAFYIVGMLAALFLTEPRVDTLKFSFANYLAQTKQGYKNLFSSAEIKFQTLLLLSVGVIVVIVDEMLNSFLGVEFGFPPEWIGAIWAVIYVAAALINQLTPQIKQVLGKQQSLILIGILIAASLVISPYLGLIAGGVSLLIRSSLQSIYGNLTSIVINDQIDSKYRATTLSTFNMFKNLPYVLTAYLFGSFADQFSAKTGAFGLGLVLIGLLSIQLIQQKPKVFLMGEKI